MRAVISLMAAQLFLAPSAHAQSALDRAEEQLELAEFEEAARLLEEVAADPSAQLDRAGVGRLLRLRAVVRAALGRDDDARDDLAALVLVLEGREPGALPQELRRQFDDARRVNQTTLRVRVRIRPLGAAEVRAIVIADDAGQGIVRRTELVCLSGGREVASSDAGMVTVRGHRELACEGRAFGPGGWRIGSSTARWRSAPAQPEPAPGGGIDEAWIWALGGVGAAVLVGVLIGVLAVALSETGVRGPVWVPRD